jgi:streptogramin lyase
MRRLRPVAVLLMFIPTTGTAAPSMAAPPVVEYLVAAGSGPEPIAAKPGGDVWFALPSEDKVGRITSAGEATLFPLPAPYEEPRGITAGPNNSVWFAETGGSAGGEGIGSISDAGNITGFPVPAAGEHPVPGRLGQPTRRPSPPLMQAHTGEPIHPEDKTTRGSEGVRRVTVEK